MRRRRRAGLVLLVAHHHVREAAAAHLVAKGRIAHAEAAILLAKAAAHGRRAAHRRTAAKAVECAAVGGAEAVARHLDVVVEAVGRRAAAARLLARAATARRLVVVLLLLEGAVLLVGGKVDLKVVVHAELALDVLAAEGAAQPDDRRRLRRRRGRHRDDLAVGKVVGRVKGDARERRVVVEGEEHRGARQVGVEVHVVERVVLRDLVVRLRPRARRELDRARLLEGVLHLDERLRAVGEQVANLAREDAHDAEEEVAGDAEGHRRGGVGDVVNGVLDVRLHDLHLGHLLLHVRREPDLGERALLGEHQL